jgi:hypothetical protein
LCPIWIGTNLWTWQNVISRNTSKQVKKKKSVKMRSKSITFSCHVYLQQSFSCLLCIRMIFIMGLYAGCLMTLYNCNGYETLTNKNYTWCTGERWLVNVL